MRKFTLFILLATAAVPTMAQRGEDNGDRQSRRSSQSSQSDDSSKRAERAERSQAREQSQVQVQRQMSSGQLSVERQHGGPDRAAAIAAMRERMDQSKHQQVQQLQVQQDVSSRSDRRRRGESIQQVQGSDYAPRQRRIRSIPDTNPVVVQQSTRDGRYSRDGRSGTSNHRGNYSRWTNNWRNDRRYDWRRHRDRNRSIFRIGFYYDPFGYSYRRYSLGSFLYSGYYQSNYWINDPWQYRLPPAYGPYRWVRYHNDALLIDTWTGEVVDVIYGFFW
jgi:Ni/Co efflux regulator RcnB